jgi:hypothetical protein
MSKLVPHWRRPWWHFRRLRFAFWRRLAWVAGKLAIVACRGGGKFDEFCMGCGQAIDPEVCHCGQEMGAHGYENHSGVPMGCRCHVARPEW